MKFTNTLVWLAFGTSAEPTCTGKVHCYFAKTDDKVQL